MSNSEDFARESLRWSQRRHNDEFGPRPLPRATEGAEMSVDLQEFGEMRANVRTLLENDKTKTESLEKLATAVQAIQLQLAEAKGGWRFFLAMGSAISAAGGAVGWLIHEFFRR